MAYVNPNELIYVMLAADTPLRAAITSGGRTRLYGPPGLPPTFAPSKAVLYFPGSGGDADLHIPKRTKEFEFRCYGETAAEANQIFGLLFAALHRKAHTRFTLSSGTAQFQYAHMVAEAEDMNEPITDWPFVRATFEVQFIDRTL